MMTKVKTSPPYRSSGGHFTAPSSQINKYRTFSKRPNSPYSSSLSPSSDHHRDFTLLPNDLLSKIAATFDSPDLQAASLVCKSWRDGLQPLREALDFRRLGKVFKHGCLHQDLTKALDSFLKGVELGSTLAMVDAGLMYWEAGMVAEAVAMYQRAAEMGDHTGICNLGISYLRGNPPNHEEGIKWLQQAAVAGYTYAQYQLALFLHHGRRMPDCNLSEAARWFLRAAEGGYVHAMYYTSLCYSSGKGFAKSYQNAKKWMKIAAQHGHVKAKIEYRLFFNGAKHRECRKL